MVSRNSTLNCGFITLYVLLICCIMFTSAELDLIPRYIRIALSGNQSQSMRISWTTNQMETAYIPTVSYGYGADSLHYHTVPKQCESLQYYDEGEYHHTCKLGLLDYSSKYYYRIGRNKYEYSPVHSFFTGPKYLAPQKSLILGDLGLVNGENTAYQIHKLLQHDSTISHIAHVGDISYADDVNFGKENPDFEPVFNQFMDMIEPITSSRAYMVAIGNHDISASIAAPDDILPKWSWNATQYNGRWNMPSDTSGGVLNMWYSYTMGNTFYIVINTETDYDGAPFNEKTPTKAGGFGDQQAWLEKQLKNAQHSRGIVPWIVVLGHRPLYTTLKPDHDYPANHVETMRTWLEPLFKKYRVDLYISGHAHLYERTYPTYQGKATQTHYNNPQDTVYVVNGAAGNIEDHCPDATPELPDYMPYRNGEHFGYGIVQTYYGLPPQDPKTILRDNSIGDRLGQTRGINKTLNNDEMEQYYNELDQYQREMKYGQNNKNSKLTNINTLLYNSKYNNITDKTCKNVISMCYSFYPTFKPDNIQYTDRFCITKC